jgi:hypothetical protein
MSQDIQKSFLVRLIVISLIVSVAWYLIVGPQVIRVQEISEAHESQIEDISVGEEAINKHASQLTKSLQQMSEVRDQLILQFDVGHSSNYHKHLQEAAESHGLTVSRIEPLRTSVAKRESEKDQGDIKLESKEFRVECGGSYAGIVEYLEGLSNGPSVAKVSTFRIIPTSTNQARMIMQVSVYHLIETPDSFSKTQFDDGTQLAAQGDDHADS